MLRRPRLPPTDADRRGPLFRECGDDADGCERHNEEGDDCDQRGVAAGERPGAGSGRMSGWIIEPPITPRVLVRASVDDVSTRNHATRGANARNR